jgi:ADP-heptose:LPS heptosyltransferase
MASQTPPSGRDMPLLSRICRLMGNEGQLRFVRLTARCLRGRHPISLPDDVAKAKRVAIVLSELPLDALHQLQTVIALVSRFTEAEIVVVCELQVASFFEHIQGISEIVTYEAAERYLFSRELTSLGNMLSQREFDVCFLLERRPDPSLLHLMARMCPKVRIGYEGALGYPFLNVRVRPKGVRTHIAEQNLLVAEAVGAKRPDNTRWTVSKEIVREVVQAIRESGIPQNVPLAGLDAGFFHEQFGEQWTDLLIDALRGLDRYSWYLYSYGAPVQPLLDWLESRKLPTFSALSPSRSAALVDRSAVVVSGRAVMFELAHLLGKPVVGVFEADELSRYCAPGRACRAVSYSGSPGEETVGQARAAVEALMGAAPAPEHNGGQVR